MNPRPQSFLAVTALSALTALAQPAAGQVPAAAPATAAPMAGAVEAQPLLAQVNRLREALDYLGSPLPAETRAGLDELVSVADDGAVTRRVQALLDPHCLAVVHLRRGSPPAVVEGAARRVLVEQGWRTFLVKVVNETGAVGRLAIESPNARPLPHAPREEVPRRWLQLSTYEGRPLGADLGGLGLEYRTLLLYGRDAGTAAAVLRFGVGDGGDGPLRRWRFGGERGTDGWHAMHQVEIEAREGSLWTDSTGRDPYMGSVVEGGGSGDRVLRFWARSEIDGAGQVFWWTKERPSPDGRRRVDFILEPGREHLYEIRFHSAGELAGVRIDPGTKPGAVRFDWIDLHAARGEADWVPLALEFEVEPSARLTFAIVDDEDRPAAARFLVTDAAGRVYPAPSKRLAPDFFFQRQIYRYPGEGLPLPPGRYTVECSRGPESLPEVKTVEVGGEPVTLSYRVRRWIDPSRLGWWSGDHHIHAAGCKHYESPTEGVDPPDMQRHIMGEDLKVGCCLTWGPCFDYQKQFFTGAVDQRSRYPYLLRYDIEVSGFGSHQSGHLNLLNLRQQIYPGGDSKHHWPTLGLNTLRWAKAQGAVCGPAHSAIGITRTVGRVPGTEGLDGPGGLPHFDLPAYDGIGANEFIVDVTHRVPGPGGELVPAVDFISAMDTQRTAEWNMWYHVLNCGFRVAVSGETDFPCLSGERVGLGRVYVKVDGELDFEKWVAGLAAGRSYVSDGRGHLINFAAEAPGRPPVAMGEGGGEIALEGPARVTFSARAAARLDGAPEVAVELVVNGYPVAQRTLAADGVLRDLAFEAEITDSTWAALRIFPHAHTNPVYIKVAGRPVRASAHSARWALLGVDQCWKNKQQSYAAAEQEDARAAYEHARQTYRRILAEAEAR